MSPCRRRCDPGPGWQLVERLDGSHQPLEPQPDSDGIGALGPWELGFWRLAPVDA